MADIKFKIQINDTESLEFDNEKILNFRTRTRSTSEPDLPVFNVFASEGTLTIKDDDLSIYAKAEQGIFDNYEYNVDVTLNDVLIAKHKISQRPYYNYSDKTLTIQLGNSIDMFDNLTYEGYSYPGIYTTESFPVKPQPLSAIFEHIFAKAFNITGTWQEITDKIWTNYFKSTNYDDAYDDYLGGSNYGYGVMSNISIDYPYMPSKRFREAFSSVLSRAKLSMVINYDGHFKLVKNEKSLNDILNIGAVIIPNDYISSPFETSVILGNKFDNAQVSSTNIKTDILSDELYVENITPPTTSGVLPNSALTKTMGDSYTLRGDGIRVRVIKLESAESYEFKDKKITIPKYENFSEILQVDELKPENISITCKHTTIKQSANNASISYGAGENNPVHRFTYDFSNSAKTTEEEYITNSASFFVGEKTVQYNGESQAGTLEAVDVKFILPDFFENNIITLLNNSFNLTVGATVGTKFSIVYSESDLTGALGGYSGSNLPVTKEEHIYEPLEIILRINGVRKKISFNSVEVQKSGYLKNIASVDNLGELLQYKDTLTESSEPIKYINGIVNYYANGLHTAKVTVLGGQDYYHDNDSQTPFAKPIFTMGDVLDFKGYDNESIMNYRRSDIPIKWQVVDNELEFEGGACYQNLIVKEIPRFSMLEYTLNSDGKSYSVSGITVNETSTDIVIPYFYNGLPITNINNNVFAFNDKIAITSINIPIYVSVLSDFVFAGCSELKNVDMQNSNSLTEIGENVFAQCVALEKITFPASLTKIEKFAFDGCSNLSQVVFNGGISGWKVYSGSTVRYTFNGNETAEEIAQMLKRTYRAYTWSKE